jgi:hypothetical protein
MDGTPTSAADYYVQFDVFDTKVHVQSDLTHEVFIERYGEFGFVLLRRNRWCGIYYSFNNQV